MTNKDVLPIVLFNQRYNKNNKKASDEKTIPISTQMGELVIRLTCDESRVTLIYPFGFPLMFRKKMQIENPQELTTKDMRYLFNQAGKDIQDWMMGSCITKRETINVA